jgi:hypothetical protein
MSWRRRLRRSCLSSPPPRAGPGPDAWEETAPRTGGPSSATSCPTSPCGPGRRPGEAHPALAADKPVLLSFFFSTCTTICPVLSAGVRPSQGPGSGGGRCEWSRSPSIPTTTRPRCCALPEAFGAVPEWQLLTGSRGRHRRRPEGLRCVQPDKTAHRPLHLLRPAGGDSGCASTAHRRLGPHGRVPRTAPALGASPMAFHPAHTVACPDAEHPAPLLGLRRGLTPRDDADDLRQGERMYRDGVLPSGSPCGPW